MNRKEIYNSINDDIRRFGHTAHGAPVQTSHTLREIQATLDAANRLLLGFRHCNDPFASLDDQGALIQIAAIAIDALDAC